MNIQTGLVWLLEKAALPLVDTDIIRRLMAVVNSALNMSFNSKTAQKIKTPTENWISGRRWRDGPNREKGGNTKQG